MFTHNLRYSLITRLLIKIIQGTPWIILIFWFFCLGCASLQLDDNMNDPDKSLEVAMVTVSSYIIADRLKASSQDYRPLHY